jgi:hypothetical protein
MCTSLTLSGLGLILGMLYTLYTVFLRHALLESVLGNSIPYFKSVGALALLGMLFFFAFLLSLLLMNNSKSRSK